LVFALESACVSCEVRTLSSHIIYITSKLKSLQQTDRMEDLRILKLISNTLQRAKRDGKGKKEEL
jgi:hypothetical protein